MGYGEKLRKKTKKKQKPSSIVVFTKAYGSSKQGILLYFVLPEPKMTQIH